MSNLNTDEIQLEAEDYAEWKMRRVAPDKICAKIKKGSAAAGILSGETAGPKKEVDI